MLSHDNQLEPASMAWQDLGTPCSIPGQETGAHPARVPAVWICVGFAGMVVLATTFTWSGSRSSALLALCVLVCVGGVLRALWAEARSVRKDGDSSEFDGPPTRGNTGKRWDFELQPVPAESRESIDSKCEEEDEDELVIWVELEDEDDENEEGDGLGEDYGEEEDSDPWEWPDTRDAG